MTRSHQSDPDHAPVLVAGLRSPWARAGGAFRGEDAGHLGARITRELLAQCALDPAELDEVICGCVGPPHDQANVGRVIALRAGVPRSVPARTVGRNCASGMEAVTQAATEILAGRGTTFLCLGVEVMSAYPLIMNRKLTGFFERMMRARDPLSKLSTVLSFRPGMLAPRIALTEGLTDPVSGMIMGSTAELLARDFGITREEADLYALQSHKRAREARDEGRFEGEIVPHLGLGARPDGRSLESDDGIRDEQTLEALAKLRPYFEKPDGIVTVGNACGITDGACALLVTSRARAKELGIEPLAEIRSFAWSGCDPARMGLGPVYASARALADAGCELSDMGRIELNEAFAAQVLACAKAFESDAFAAQHLGRGTRLGTLEMQRTNVDGGAIALGHPVGATGARLLLTTARQLIDDDRELGLATLCIGGGQGGAVVLERAA